MTLKVSALEPTCAAVIRLDPQCEHEGIRAAQLTDGSYLLAGNLVNTATGSGSIAICHLNEYGDTISTRQYGSSGALWTLTDWCATVNGWMLAGVVDSVGNTSGAIWQIDSTGQLITQVRYRMTGERVRFTALVDALEGGWLLAGYRLEIATNRYRFHVRKLDDALQTTWTKDYNVRLGQLLDAEQVPDSSYLFTGYLLDQGDTSGCLFVLHTDLLGDSLWLRKYFGNGWASGASLAQLQSGFVVAGATSVSSVSPSDRFVVRCNEPGDSLWTRSLGTANQERIHDILPVEDDCLLLVGESASQLDVTKFDSSGSLLWSHTHMAGLNDRGKHAFQTAEGNYAIVGTAGAGSGSSAFYFLVMDTSGAIVLNLVDGFPKPNYLHFYPNPAKGIVRLAPGPVKDLVIFDLLGRVRMRVPEARESLDLGSLLPGCYIVEAENESGAHLQGKLIVAE
ncbi:MAG: T9SS type A sorting domain-containing protein [Bacteroidia bacterium]